jgi:hypothetical protein
MPRIPHPSAPLQVSAGEILSFPPRKILHIFPEQMPPRHHCPNKTRRVQRPKRGSQGLKSLLTARTTITKF